MHAILPAVQLHILCDTLQWQHSSCNKDAPPPRSHIVSNAMSVMHEQVHVCHTSNSNKHALPSTLSHRHYTSLLRACSQLETKLPVVQLIIHCEAKYNMQASMSTESSPRRHRLPQAHHRHHLENRLNVKRQLSSSCS